MLLLSNDDIESVLDVKSCIAVMEDAYRETLEVPTHLWRLQ